MYELLEKMILETKQFEQHKKLLEGMSDKILEGIEAAKQDLTKEKEKLEQEEVSVKQAVDLLSSSLPPPLSRVS